MGIAISFQRFNRGRSVTSAEWKAARSHLWAAHHLWSSVSWPESVGGGGGGESLIDNGSLRVSDEASSCHGVMADTYILLIGIADIYWALSMRVHASSCIRYAHTCARARVRL